MMEPIRGKVAKILDSRQVVLNVGSSDGVAIDMIFKVVNPEGEQIRDPDTNQVLGSLESPKTRIRILEVHDRLSVATPSADSQGFVSITLGPFARALMPPRWVDQYESLGTNLSTVAIGDPVVQVMQVEAK